MENKKDLKFLKLNMSQLGITRIVEFCEELKIYVIGNVRNIR